MPVSASVAMDDWEEPEESDEHKLRNYIDGLHEAGGSEQPVFDPAFRKSMGKLRASRLVQTVNVVAEPAQQVRTWQVEVKNSCDSSVLKSGSGIATLRKLEEGVRRRPASSTTPPLCSPSEPDAATLLIVCTCRPLPPAAQCENLLGRR